MFRHIKDPAADAVSKTPARSAPDPATVLPNIWRLSPSAIVCDGPASPETVNVVNPDPGTAQVLSPLKNVVASAVPVALNDAVSVPVVVIVPPAKFTKVELAVATEVTVPVVEEFIVTAPVAPEIVIPVPATIEVTPVLVKINSGPATNAVEIPVPPDISKLSNLEIVMVAVVSSSISNKVKVLASFNTALAP